jgi:uncharacterized protein YprB with RNaseH-like and TPR domain
MSDMQDRFRRLANMRSPRKRQTPVRYVPDFDDSGEHISPLTRDFEREFEVEEAHPIARTSSSATLEPLPDQSLDRLVPGRLLTNEAGICYCAEQAFSLDDLRGPNPLGNLLDLPPALFHRYHPAFGLAEMADYRRAAFIDTETTGLGGGAGVYCFMVGVGTFETYRPYAADQLPVEASNDQLPTHFVVRQFFMRNPAEEAALLVALAQLLEPYEMTVTFNGRSFDLPLLRLRYMQNRRFLPIRRDVTLLQPDRPHLDLLMPARRLWRRRLQSCRLINLEQMILGLHRSEEDVPGALIPQLYQSYVQNGHAGAMRRVFYHNHEDIVTMVALADHLGRAFGDTESCKPTGASPALPVVMGMDWAGLGRVHERAGDFAQAIQAYQRALESVRTPSDRAEIFRALGEIYKRQGEWTQATETWQQWLTSVPGTDPTPYVELAKYYEWVARDFEQAEMWTAWALHNLQKAHPAAQRPGEQRNLTHRLARIQRKRGGTGTDEAAE